MRFPLPGTSPEPSYRQLTGGEIRKVTMYLHGSFATTYRGHGTDKALLAGILDMLPSDERLRDSFRLADEAGIQYTFIPTDLGEDYRRNRHRCHPYRDWRIDWRRSGPDPGD